MIERQEDLAERLRKKKKVKLESSSARWIASTINIPRCRLRCCYISIAYLIHQNMADEGAQAQSDSSISTDGSLDYPLAGDRDAAFMKAIQYTFTSGRQQQKLRNKMERNREQVEIWLQCVQDTLGEIAASEETAEKRRQMAVEFKCDLRELSRMRDYSIYQIRVCDNPEDFQPRNSAEDNLLEVQELCEPLDCSVSLTELEQLQVFSPGKLCTMDIESQDSTETLPCFP